MTNWVFLVCTFTAFLCVFQTVPFLLIRKNFFIHKSSTYSKIKPPFTPPSIIFRIVWPILYTLMALYLTAVCYELYKDEDEKGVLIAAVILFSIHLLFNWSWVPVFINKMYKISFAFIIIMFLLAGSSVATSWQKIPVWSRYILFPYFVWLCFAIVLNTYILKYKIKTEL